MDAVTPTPEQKNDSQANSTVKIEHTSEEWADMLLKEARSWLGTPYLENGKLKGVGVDCLHFVDLVALGIGLPGFSIPAGYTPGSHAAGGVMLQVLDTHLDFVPTKTRRPGDIIAFVEQSCQNMDEPTHVAFVDKVTSSTTFIIEAGTSGVIRHRIDGFWIKRIHSVWRFRNI
jgi:cell wall-associated NlpC family hydrolase